MTRLCVRRQNGQTTDLDLTAATYTIGRSNENDVVLEGGRVSRHHGKLQREGEGYLLFDLDSHNGTFVNGLRINQPLKLKPGDEISIGPHALFYGSPAEPVTVPGPVTVSLEKDYAVLLSEATSCLLAAKPAGLDTRPDEEPQKEQRTLRLLFDLSHALSSLYSVSEVSEKALDILLETTRAERGAIFLLDERGSLNLATVRVRDAPPGAPPPVVELSSTIADRILKERKGILTADAATDDRFAHGYSVVVRQLRSLACAPLLGKSGDLGILYLENNQSIGAFTHGDLSLLCAVASQIGLAIENARFFDALRRTNEELEQIVEERTSALRETQLKLFQSEKMAALSRLVAGVAHEINNPLGALKSNLELLTQMSDRASNGTGVRGEDTAMFRDMASLGQTSLLACARIMAVVRALTSFVRLDEAEFKRASLNQSVQTVLQLMDPSVRRGATIKTSLGDLPEIPCYPALLNQALTHLIENSCQAIGQSGEVMIETLQDGDHVLLRIRDTGRGIAKEHLPRIFEPGFTTKGVGVGVGMGLAVVRRIIQEHRGTIAVESEPDRGCLVTVRLPLRAG
jgi:signal transduction histidine kinase